MFTIINKTKHHTKKMLKIVTNIMLDSVKNITSNLHYISILNHEIKFDHL